MRKAEATVEGTIRRSGAKLESGLDVIFGRFPAFTMP